MGSSPRLDFGWVRVPAHGFKSQSVVNSFTGDMSLIPGQATGSMGHGPEYSLACMPQFREGTQRSISMPERRSRLLQVRLCVCAKLIQSCPPLCDPVDCSPPGSSVHGILQARILEWVAMPFSRESNSGLLHLPHWQARSLPLTPPDAAR